MPTGQAGGGREPTKAQLQRRMDDTRTSISKTVEEIKETVGGQYESVKRTVSEVLGWREQFQKDPIAWSLGALSAGFALGYTLGYAHRGGRRHSEVAAFADSVVDELSRLSKNLLMPSLSAQIKQLFGFDFAELLKEIGGARNARGRGRGARTIDVRNRPPRRGASTRHPNRGKSRI